MYKKQQCTTLIEHILPCIVFKSKNNSQYTFLLHSAIVYTYSYTVYKAPEFKVVIVVFYDKFIVYWFANIRGKIKN